MERSQRIYSIDTFRVAAILAVIFLHSAVSLKGGQGLSPYVHFFAVQTARFAVPFFFIVSGYLWGRKITPDTVFSVSMAHGKRIALIFAFWCAFYLVYPLNADAFHRGGLALMLDNHYLEVMDLVRHPARLLIGGSHIHLWFLFGLLNAVIITSLFLMSGLKRLLIPGAAALYIVGLMAGAYAGTPWGFSLHFMTRNGPFFATIFFVAGWWLATEGQRSITLRRGIYLALFGFIMHLTEVYMLWSRYGIPPVYDYVLGTLPFGIGVTIIALSLPRLGNRTFLPLLGCYTLGVYVIHFVFIDLVGISIHRAGMASWFLGNCAAQFFFPVIVYALSVGAVILLARSAVIRKVIM